MPQLATTPALRTCPNCHQQALVRRIRVVPSASGNGAGSNQSFRCRACGYEETGATTIIAGTPHA